MRPVISLSGTTETEEAFSYDGAGEWVADTAIDVWNATTDFVEDAGDWIAETASDAWDATTDFFEDVGGFFCELFA